MKHAIHAALLVGIIAFPVSLRADIAYNPSSGTLSGISKVYVSGPGSTTGLINPGFLFASSGKVSITSISTTYSKEPGEGGAVTNGANSYVTPSSLDAPQIYSPSGVCNSAVIYRHDGIFWPNYAKTLDASSVGHLIGGAPTAGNTDCTGLTWTDQGNSSGVSPLNMQTFQLANPNDGDFVVWCGQGQPYQSGSANGEASFKYEYRRTWNAGSSTCTDTTTQLARDGRRKVISMRVIRAS